MRAPQRAHPATLGYDEAMVPRYARPELEVPLARIATCIDEAIEGLRPYGRSALWNEAISAMVALSRATSHLVRAQLVLLGSVAAGARAEGADLERFAAGVELLHLFMLVHDDVMDDATLRRGKPTLRVAILAADPKLGAHEASDLAIVLGNLLHVQAMRHLFPCTEGAAALVLEACSRAGAGQFHDLLGMRALGDDEEVLRLELVDKGAFHAFVAPLAAGMLLARPAVDTSHAVTWGKHVGLAYQGADDLADLVGSPVVTGKDGLRDLLKGRASLPLLLLRKRAAGEDRAFLDALAARQTMDIGERAHLHRLLQGSRVAEACAAWVRAELAAAERARKASGFQPEASEGLAAIERGLAAYVERIAAEDRD
jgi:geranylgeranyl diphosphate synthase type I